MIGNTLRGSKLLVLCVGTFALVAVAIEAVRAGSALLRNSAVGGVVINAEGIVDEPSDQMWRETRQDWEQFVLDPPPEAGQATEIRKVSLRQLEAALKQALTERGGAVPQEVRFLAGLQRIEYVLVYPEQQDIVLAGPGEAWKVDERGNVVGVGTGLPVLQLDDLLVAMRSVAAAREGTLTCSIEPRPEGVRAMHELLRQQRGFQPALLEAVEQAMGPQNVIVEGVPDTSHFARVMVAADYRMKRIAMHLEPSPIRELPSFLEMAQNSSIQFGNVMPRWWLACDYQPLARSEDGLAWQLRGQGVKVLTEQNRVAADGTSTPLAGRKLPLAERWADTMTEHYMRLAQELPIFAELRNVMDLCVVAALIERENLLEKAGIDGLPCIMGEMVLDAYNAPRTVSTQSSFIRQRRGFIITASGGVDIDPWSAASRSELDPALQQLHRGQAARPAGEQWWWN